MFDFQEELKKLPNRPGVYIMHDSDDTIIYVGKAVNLHNRVRSYFRKIVGRGPQIDKMVRQIARFEYIVTDSELEALVLENNLIKEHEPKYNTMLKDDKTYPYIKVTVAEAYPRILFSREMKKDRSRYFGPYTSAAAVKDTIELMNGLFMLRTCNRFLPRDIGLERPCLNQHIKQCCAPCTGDVSQEEYRKRVDGALGFLGGDYAPVLTDLETKMNHASDEMDYEEAVRYRDLLASVKSVAQKQKITDSDMDDKDIIALAKEEQDAVVQVFFIRTGKLIGREHFYMTHVSGRDCSSILLDFVKQYYAGTPFIPHEIMIQYDIDDRELIEKWLSDRKGSRVYIHIPQKGTKEKLVELAAENASLVLSKDKERIKLEEARTTGAVHEIEKILGIASLSRMEAFDISNISGFANVGSMVVYEGGKPKRSDYRKFRIRSVAGPNDYACMYEVLTRRFRHGLDEKAALSDGPKENETHGNENIQKGMDSFMRFPDLIMMDGGRGQVNIALRVLEELGISIPVCGMVKDDNHRTRGIYFQNEEMPIDQHSEGFRLVTRIQDEAHRFAIEYHRSIRLHSQVKSVLDEIPGIGPQRRLALMRKYESIQEIKDASPEELSQIPEIPLGAAEKIHEYLNSHV